MTWATILGGLLTVAQLFFKWKVAGDATRLTLALERIKQLEKATDDEINNAVKARDRVARDPHAGEL